MLDGIFDSLVKVSWLNFIIDWLKKEMFNYKNIIIINSDLVLKRLLFFREILIEISNSWRKKRYF